MATYNTTLPPFRVTSDGVFLLRNETWFHMEDPTDLADMLPDSSWLPEAPPDGYCAFFRMGPTVYRMNHEGAVWQLPEPYSRPLRVG